MSTQAAILPGCPCCCPPTLPSSSSRPSCVTTVPSLSLHCCHPCVAVFLALLPSQRHRRPLPSLRCCRPCATAVPAPLQSPHCCTACVAARPRCRPPRAVYLALLPSPRCCPPHATVLLALLPFSRCCRLALRCPCATVLPVLLPAHAAVIPATSTPRYHPALLPFPRRRPPRSPCTFAALSLPVIAPSTIDD